MQVDTSSSMHARNDVDVVFLCPTMLSDVPAALERAGQVIDRLADTVRGEASGLSSRGRTCSYVGC
jgi:hypothetical protein